MKKICFSRGYKRPKSNSKGEWNLIDVKNCFQTVNGDDNLNKQDLIDKGYKHVCTQNSESKIELWAKFNGYKDTIVYLYYIPKWTWY